MDTQSNVELSVVLPAYLEEENLRVLLPRLKKVVATLTPSFEILVVDTAEPMDHTRDVCEEHDVRYMNRTGGNAFGDAVRTGIEAAYGRRLIFMDADGSHTPEFIPTMWEKRDSDVVIASRYINGGVTENSRALVWMSLILNMTYSIVLGLRCKDVSNSFKLYRTHQLREFDLECDNFDIVEEILFKLKKLNPGLKMIEIPFTFKKRMFGETKRNLLQFISTYLLTILKLRFMRVQRRSQVPSAVENLNGASL